MDVKCGGEFSYLENVESICSAGSHSREWLSRTFSNVYTEQIEEKLYVTGNWYAPSEMEVKPPMFENALKYETKRKTSLAHLVTDRAITLSRESDWKKLIIHYMQPHKPFYRCGDDRYDVELSEYGSNGEPSVYQPYFRGEKIFSDLQEAFLQNLRYVLQEPGVLIGNINAPQVAITSDHGQALGEQFLWDHRSGVQHPPMRKVPWVGNNRIGHTRCSSPRLRNS